MDPDVEEARRAHQLQGPSEGVMARYGVRVLPPRAIATDGTTPTVGRADTAAKEARAAEAAAKGATAAEARRKAAAAAAREGAVHPIPPGRESGPPAASSS